MIGILFIGIGEYHKLFADFHRGCNAFFFPDIPKRYFFVSDLDFRQNEHVLPKDVVGVNVARCLWPWPTLNRFHYYLELKKIGAFDKISHVFFFNSNCRFLSLIDNPRFLSAELIATKHPGYFLSERGTYPYESREESAAFVKNSEGRFYLAGGFQGGRVTALASAFSHCLKLLHLDMSKSIIAKWHDESYWNRYIIDAQNNEILDLEIAGPEYLVPVGQRIPLNPKIVILHKEFIFTEDGRNLQQLKT